MVAYKTAHINQLFNHATPGSSPVIATTLTYYFKFTGFSTRLPVAFQETV